MRMVLCNGYYAMVFEVLLECYWSYVIIIHERKSAIEFVLSFMSLWYGSRTGYHTVCFIWSVLLFTCCSLLYFS